MKIATILGGVGLAMVMTLAAIQPADAKAFSPDGAKTTTKKPVHSRNAKAPTLLMSKNAKGHARDMGMTDGRAAVTYDVQLDWVYSATGQVSHSGYTIVLFYDSGVLVQVQDNGLQAAADSLLTGGWTYTNLEVNVLSTTPW